MQIDESLEQFENAEHSIRNSLEPGSNVTFQSALQSRKQLLQSIFTADGMQIDGSETQDRNAHFSMRDSLERASNVTLDSA
jgi:hypothetical protein